MLLPQISIPLKSRAITMGKGAKKKVGSFPKKKAAFSPRTVLTFYFYFRQENQKEVNRSRTQARLV
jgi:hypothetical protein